ncbi:MAG: hypothetical protein K0S74_343 [Chlamydiales bacterium]|jgi:hypothetical protein|nr:hypothetical protein [Chlamydiales bacterium]
MNNTVDRNVQELERLRNEWSIFADSNIKLGTKIHATWKGREIIRVATKQPPATYQIALLKTGQWWTGANTIEAAAKLGDDLIKFSQQTKQVFDQIFVNIRETSNNDKNNDETKGLSQKSLLDQALKTFTVFSQARSNLSLLQQTCLLSDEKQSPLAQAYFKAYENAIQQVEGDFAIISQLYKQLREKEIIINSNFNMGTKLKLYYDFLSQDIETVTQLTSEQCAKLMYPLEEFLSAINNLHKFIDERALVFRHYDDNSLIQLDQRTILDIEGCYRLASILDTFKDSLSFLSQIKEQLKNDPSATHLIAFAKELLRVINSSEGGALITSLTAIGSNGSTKATQARTQILRLPLYKEDKANQKLGFKNGDASWQEIAIQYATSRLWMPLKEILNVLCDFKAPKECVHSLLKVLEQLYLVAEVAQQLSPSQQQQSGWKFW